MKNFNPEVVSRPPVTVFDLLCYLVAVYGCHFTQSIFNIINILRMEKENTGIHEICGCAWFASIIIQFFPSVFNNKTLIRPNVYRSQN